MRDFLGNIESGRKATVLVTESRTSANHPKIFGRVTILLTGFGKTACFACIPAAFDFYHKKSVEASSIIVVISPLTALIKDQVKKRGVCCDSDSEVAIKNDVNKGVFNIVFMSPELLVGKWRSLFVSDIYKKRLVGLIVDEAHCVIKW